MIFHTLFFTCLLLYKLRDVTVLRTSHHSTGLQLQEISNDLFRTESEILKTQGNI